MGRGARVVPGAACSQETAIHRLTVKLRRDICMQTHMALAPISCRTVPVNRTGGGGGGTGHVIAAGRGQLRVVVIQYSWKVHHAAVG